MTKEKKAEKSQQDGWLERAIVEFDEKRFKDGDILSHDWIHWALDIPPFSSTLTQKDVQFILLQRFDAFRDYLLIQRKIWLQNVRGSGYRVVPPNEQAQVAAEEAMRLIRRGLDKGDRILTHTRFSEMTNEEAARHTNTHIRISGLQQMVSKQRTDILASFGPKLLNQ